MASPQHRAARKQLGKLVKAGRAYCAQDICVMPDRWIPPDTPSPDWHVLHDANGIHIIGPGHARCNILDARRRERLEPEPTRWRV
jgi:hypothetical protein